jgi:hypothetical protein
VRRGKQPIQTLTRLTDMSARWLGGLTFAVALAATGCGQSPAPPPAHAARIGSAGVRVRTINGSDLPASPMPVTPAAGQHAIAAAIRTAASAILPPGSRAVSRRPANVPPEPFQLSACNPIEDATELWLVPGFAEDLMTFLRANPPAGMTAQAFGTGGQPTGDATTYFVADVPPGNQPANTLVFTFAAAGRDTGLRVDALSVPAGAACASAG